MKGAQATQLFFSSTSQPKWAPPPISLAGQTTVRFPVAFTLQYIHIRARLTLCTVPLCCCSRRRRGGGCSGEERESQA